MYKALSLNKGYCSVWESLHPNPIKGIHKSINCVKKDDIIAHYVAKRDSCASLYHLLVKSLQSFEYKQSRFRQQKLWTMPANIGFVLSNLLVLVLEFLPGFCTGWHIVFKVLQTWMMEMIVQWSSNIRFPGLWIFITLMKKRTVIAPVHEFAK